jgi:hypothetical protein
MRQHIREQLAEETTITFRPIPLKNYLNSDAFSRS